MGCGAISRHELVAPRRYPRRRFESHSVVGFEGLRQAVSVDDARPQMTRRDAFIGSASVLAALAQAPAQRLIRPKPLSPGDTVGLITPSTYVSDPDRLALAERTISYFGLKTKWG